MPKIKYIASERKKQIGEEVAMAVKLAMAAKDLKPRDIKAFGCVHQNTTYNLERPLTITLGELVDLAEQLPNLEFATPLKFKMKGVS